MANDLCGADLARMSAEELELLAFRVSPTAQVITHNRLMVKFNDAFAALFGYRREELLNQLILKLYPSMADYRVIGERCLAWLRESRSRSYADERFMQNRSGEVFWARAQGVTLTPRDPFDLMVWSFARLDAPLRSTDSLTAREREISTYIVNGLTCKEIARKLGISHRTVETHRARLMKKLDARNTAELVSRIIVIS
ncbi:LuxR C-terminal-related transcriptional regulator [Thauera sedimentorum]|nr:LuxR C-terminal-related transcriptional regulator [Thauera sedimentorum]